MLDRAQSLRASRAAMSLGRDVVLEVDEGLRECRSGRAATVEPGRAIAGTPSTANDRGSASGPPRCRRASNVQDRTRRRRHQPHARRLAATPREPLSNARRFRAMARTDAPMASSRPTQDRIAWNNVGAVRPAWRNARAGGLRVLAMVMPAWTRRPSGTHRCHRLAVRRRRADR